MTVSALAVHPHLLRLCRCVQEEIKEVREMEAEDHRQEVQRQEEKKARRVAKRLQREEGMRAQPHTRISQTYPVTWTLTQTWQQPQTLTCWMGLAATAHRNNKGAGD